VNVGDKIPVSIAGHTVAQATVKEIAEGQATLVVPGTIVVMAVRTELAPDVVAAPESQTVLLTDNVVTPEQAATQQVPQAQPAAQPQTETAPVVANETASVTSIDTPPAAVAPEVQAAVEDAATQ